MLKDFFENYNLHFFMVFFAFVFIRWAIVYFNAVQYEPYKYDKKMNYFTSVLIPVVDEPLDLFKDVLLNIAKQSPSEIIVVINGPKNEKLEFCCYQLQYKLE